MGDVINYLQHRVEEVKRELQDTVNRRIQAQNDELLLSEELRGYEKTLAAEIRRQGFGVPIPDTQGSLPLAVPEQTIEDVTNKAEFARQFVRSHDGVTPSEIFKGFEDAGIPIKKPYIYALVQRLEKQKAIRQKRDKWYPVLESEQSVNGTAEKALP